eukprot:TRINITY_DN50453_c0_g1_i1.p1 TRINITY_DN50453_c0_g1~~TRINITY_DN50453_c0_g1_i1.p1  ORF type:complete len:546 (-),score=65.81 TRINITY_DN50453_c0_g1_i1:160-1797(-)
MRSSEPATSTVDKKESFDTAEHVTVCSSNDLHAEGLDLSRSGHGRSSSWHNYPSTPRRSSWAIWRTHLVDPRRTCHKYVVHFVLCFFIPGPYFMDSAIGAYKTQICAPSGLDIDSVTYSWLFALPAVTGVLCGPLGVVIERLGATTCAVVSGSIVFLSSIGVVIGLKHQQFEVMLWARVTFWLGLYACYAVQTTVVYRLFQGPALTIAYGLLIASCRLGGVVGYFASGFVLNDLAGGDVVGALWYSVACNAVALAATLLFAALRSGTSVARTVLPLLETQQNGDAHEQESVGSVRLFLQHVRGLPPATWLLIIQIGLAYSAIFPFESIAGDYFETRWDLSPYDAGIYTSIAGFFGLMSWSIGIFIRSTRSLLRGLIISWTLLAGAFVFLGLHKPATPALGMSLCGLAYAYISTVSWVMFPQALGDRQDCKSSAVTMGYVGMSAGLFVSNLFVGFLNDSFGYGAVCVWLLALAVAGLVVSCCIAYLVGDGFDSEVDAVERAVSLQDTTEEVEDPGSEAPAQPAADHKAFGDKPPMVDVAVTDSYFS